MSGMCHTMHSGYPWRLFHLKEKVKSVVKSVFAVRGYSMYCVSHAPSMLLNELPVIATVVLHLACKSKPLTKKGISCPNQDARSH